ncbi:MAG: RNA polymerase sigma factor [Odoribacter splanchnicus]
MSFTVDFERIKNDDKKYFEYIFQVYSKEFYAFAYRILKDKEKAEDIIQDFFVKLWINRHKINITSSFKTFSYTAIHNSSLNNIRYNKRLTDLADYAPQLINDVEFEIRRAELREKLEHAIELLPDRCKVIFTKTCIEDKSYQKVADELNISVNTVKVQMSKAYKILRERLADEQLLILFLTSLLSALKGYLGK